MIAILRPHSWDFPLLLHVFGAMVLFGAILATTTLSFVGWRVPALARSTFWALLAAAIPAWIVMRAGAAWIYSKENHQVFDKDPTWIIFGYIAAEPGALILLLATGFAFWWQRSQKAIAGRIVSGLAALYLILLVVAWLAMSGKWGS